MNIIIKKLCFIGICAIPFTSCEGYRCGNGKVLDAISQMPLDSVNYLNLTGSDDLYTDSSGEYATCNGLGGCVPDCQDIEIQFSKQGYKTVSIVNPDPDEIVYLEKE